MAEMEDFAEDETSDRVSCDKVIIRVPHIQQRHSWDCGLACAQMVLRFLQIRFDDFHEVCSRLKFGTSVWTIDLAHLFAHYKVAHHYMTITLGVNPGYSKKTYYQSNFTEDEVRITELFREPKSLGINVNKSQVSLDELKRHLQSGNVAIYLIDWSRLDCLTCDRKVMTKCFTAALKCILPYQGHYVVVVGFNEKKNLIFYKNPSYSEELCCCHTKTFDAARKSYGTDEDALFIYRNGLPPDVAPPGADSTQNLENSPDCEVSDKLLIESNSPHL